MNQGLASAILGLLAAVSLLAACLPEPAPTTTGRGHEETLLPTAKAQPPAAVPPKAQKPTSRVVTPTPAPPSLPGCRSISERFASIVKAAPDARVEVEFPPALAGDYVRAFNAINGTSIAADKVAIVVSSSWGSRAIVLFERAGCEAGTEQITFSAPGARDE